MSTDTITVEPVDYLARYSALCAHRDAVNAKNAPLEAELAKLNEQAEAFRVKAEAVAAQIDDNRGREKWLAVKREIRVLAVGLGKIPAEKTGV